MWLCHFSRLHQLCCEVWFSHDVRKVERPTSNILQIRWTVFAEGLQGRLWWNLKHWDTSTHSMHSHDWVPVQPLMYLGWQSCMYICCSLLHSKSSYPPSTCSHASNEVILILVLYLQSHTLRSGYCNVYERWFTTHTNNCLYSEHCVCIRLVLSSWHMFTGAHTQC